MPRGCAATTARRRRQRAPRRRAASRAHHHEPRPVVEDLAAAELGREARPAEPALVDAMARAVVQPALLPLLARLARRVDDHQLATDAVRLGDEALALVVEEMAVEVPGEDTLEGAGGEGGSRAVADDGDAVGQPPLGEGDHGRALIEADDEPAHVAR